RAEQLVGDDLPDDQDLRRLLLLAPREEAAIEKRPAALDRRHLDVGAVHAREPALAAEVDARVLVAAAGDVLHAGQILDCLRVGKAQRRRRSETGFEVPQAL